VEEKRSEEASEAVLKQFLEDVNKKTRSELDLNLTKTKLITQTDLTKSDQSLWWLEICQKETLVNLKPVNFI